MIKIDGLIHWGRATYSPLFLCTALVLVANPLCAAQPGETITVEGLRYTQFGFYFHVEPTGYEDDEDFIRFTEKIKTNLLWSGMYRFTPDARNSTLSIRLRYMSGQKIEAHIDSRWGSRFITFKKSLLHNKTQVLQHTIDQIVYHLTGERSFLGNAIIYVEKGDFPGYRIVLTDLYGKRRRVLVEDGNLNILPRWKPDATSVLFTSLGKSGSQLKQFSFLNNRVETFLSSQHKFSGGTWGNHQEIIVTIAKDGNSDLYRINQKGRILERLTRRTSTESNPRWSPDGKRLVFISNRSGSIQIYQRNMETGKVYRMTYESGRNVDPNWSSNGAYIVFAGIRNGRYQIFLMDREGEYVQQITDGPHSSEQPVWAPSGRQILFVQKKGSDSKLYIMNVDGRATRRVTQSGPGISEFNPTWTANFQWESGSRY